MKKLRMFVLALVAAFTLSAPALAFAQSNNIIGGDQIQTGVCTATQGSQANSTNCGSGTAAQNSFQDIVKRIVNIFSLVVGAVSVVMIIIGGFRYIISGGDSGNVSSAKNTIMYAIIGLVIVAFAQIIVNFVVARITTGS
jgi:hypothetical protein